MPAGQRTKVLILDDEPDIVDSLRSMVAAFVPNADILATTCSETASKWIEQGKVGLMLIGYRMKPRDGLEFLASTRTLQPGAKRLLMTSFHKDLLGSKAQAAGADGLLSKPVDLDILAATLRETCGP